MRESMAGFMAGRNGQDDLARVCYFAGVILLIVNLFVRNGILSLVVIVILFYAIFRIYSRNIYKRQKENAAWLRFTGGIGKRFRLMKRQWTDRKVYKYYICKSCGQTVRVPKGKGRIEITCPRCRTSFIAKT